jgi:hypothetical protein
VSGIGGKVRRLNGATLAEVKARRAAFETDQRRGEWREQSVETFTAYAAEWIESFQGRTRGGLRRESRENYRRVLDREAIPFLGRMRLAEIEPRDVKRYLAVVAGRGVAPNTVRLALAPVLALFATALEDGDVAR